ncbi:Hypothetical predicted protein [Octopus vulgaris]|uniref:Peptidase A2 domain-containing protein n=1 Tax=Octopus vulgaris TaxID=6645 RepID=A0AA36AUE2_OCTVU|nr:Hypothetical predicted protein [Octopus vulgaris]
MAPPVAVQMNLHPIMDWGSDDILEAFKKFKQKTQLAFKSFLKDTTDDEKVSYILLWSGNKGIDLFNSWDMSESDCNNPDTLLEKFERHLEPRSNHRIHRYEFQGLKQDPQETIDNFQSRLKNVAEKCKFKDREERIVDQLIWGCAHKEVQKSLIGKDALQLVEAVDTARAFEATTKQMASFSLQTSSLDSSVDTVSRHRTLTHKQRTYQYCGTEHEFNNRKKCPAFGTHCKACGKLNHWEKMCRLTKSQKYKPQFSKRSRNRRDIHAQQQEKNISEEEFLAVGIINVHEMGKDDRKKEDEAYTTIRIQKKAGRKRTNIDLRLKIDTGAQSDILPVRLYKKMFPENMTEEDRVRKGILTPSDVVLTAYGGTRIPQLGKTTITGTHKGKIIKCSFYVTRTEGPAILGLDTCRRLNIVSVNAEVKAAPSRIDSDMPIKDRPPITNKQEMEGLSRKVHHIVNVTTNNLVEIKEETSKDEELQLLTQMVIQGWPEKRHQEETREKLAATQEQSQSYYNKHAQYLPEILGGQHVHTQDPITKTWIPAQVVSRAETPRSYIIETESGRQLRRNRAHIRPTPELLRTTCTTPAALVTTPTESSPQRAQTTYQQPNNTPQTPVRSTRSTRWRKNILPPVRYR